MTIETTRDFRRELVALADRIGMTAEGLVEQARSAIADGSGNLSGAPMHLGDLGSEAYTQELNATLLENETFLRAEILDALGRIERGTYGACEHCGRPIPEERLEAVPYARHCVTCAESLHAGRVVNINDGRPQWADSYTGQVRDGAEDDGSEDRNAAGTAGGGTAVGGLAGTNVATGSPADADLERAMGSGNFDVEVEQDDANEPYAGHAGGAVGGTPAGKRASGGR